MLSVSDLEINTKNVYRMRKKFMIYNISKKNNGFFIFSLAFMKANFIFMIF